MPRIINPVGWKLEPFDPIDDPYQPLVTLTNGSGNKIQIHPVNQRLVRVVHSLDSRKQQIKQPFESRTIRWESRKTDSTWKRDVFPSSKRITLSVGDLEILVDYSSTVRLTWSWRGLAKPFLKDFKTPYTYDARTGRMFHHLARDSYLTDSEHSGKPSAEALGLSSELSSKQDGHDEEEREDREFVYGLGEVKGGMMKVGKRYTLEARDSLGYDPEETDPLYKVCPFLTIYNPSLRFWVGIYYNTLSPSVVDLGAEHDFSTGNFRSFSVENGPLDYYVLLGGDEEGERDPSQGPVSLPRLPDIITQFARLVTPHSTGPAGHRSDGWQVSPTLPPLSQFGYLASSLTLSELENAQDAVIDYVLGTRTRGFALDGMHLSSGYCLDPVSSERNYFVWNRLKYPDPCSMGERLETKESCQVIMNVKPWLLEGHPWYRRTAEQKGFVRAAPDSRPTTVSGPPVDEDRCGIHEAARTFHWSANMGDTAKGSYVDYSSSAGYEAWQSFMQEGGLDKNITGFWIDNNEFSTIMDDCQTIRGEVEMWGPPKLPEGLRDAVKTTVAGLGADHTATELTRVDEVADRMGWGGGEIAIGAVGRPVLTMGMAKSTYEKLLMANPSRRPVVVTRSFVPGMQAFAHGSWSGDNSTSWKTLKWSTKMTLSVGLSFGPGLYGHDIGGFSGHNSPSPELLVRWCQQSIWHTRFTVHSWKKVSTTLHMYDHLPEVNEILLRTLRLRYRLVPFLYSLYVTDYHRRGHPVIRPLLWYHSSDINTLTQDEQFLLGSHILVAPVTESGKRWVDFNLPFVVDAEPGRGGNDRVSWCELDTGRWHHPSPMVVEDDGDEIPRLAKSAVVRLEAPLERCPVLVREGGILVLGGECKRTVYDELGRWRRTIHLFPTPPNRRSSPSPSSFTLVEDDGISNDSVCPRKRSTTELEIGFKVEPCSVRCQSGGGGGKGGEEIIKAWIRSVHSSYPGRWSMEFVLPIGDERSVEVELIKSREGEQRDRVKLISISRSAGRHSIELAVE